MITSIIELPNFQDPSLDPNGSLSTCNDYISLNTNECQWSNLDLVLTEGRTLRVPPNLHKFKLDVLPDPASNQHWQFVVISNAELNLNDDKSFIFPVYVRRPDGSVIINTDCVNEMFEYFNIVQSSTGKRVVSTISFISTIANACGSFNMREDDMPAMSYLGRDEQLLEIINNIGYDGLDESVVADYHRIYAVKSTAVPREIVYIFSLRNMGQVRIFVNQYALAANTELIAAASSSKSTWPDMYRHLHQNNLILTQATDVMLPQTEAMISYMGRFLTEAYTVAGDDYWIDIRTDPASVSDLYYRAINPRAGFSSSTSRLDKWANLTFNALYAMDLGGRFRNQELCMHRTCMDEIVIYNKSDLSNPLLYLDMVWWTLCSAPGLINESNAMFF